MKEQTFLISSLAFSTQAASPAAFSIGKSLYESPTAILSSIKGTTVNSTEQVHTNGNRWVRRFLNCSHSPQICKLEEKLRMDSSFWMLAGFQKPDALSFHVVEYFYAQENKFKSTVNDIRRIEEEIAQGLYGREKFHQKIGEIILPLRDRIDNISKVIEMIINHPMEITLSLAVEYVRRGDRDLIQSLYKDVSDEMVRFFINQLSYSLEDMVGQINRFCTMTIDLLKFESYSDVDLCVQIKTNIQDENSRN